MPQAAAAAHADANLEELTDLLAFLKTTTSLHLSSLPTLSRPAAANLEELTYLLAGTHTQAH